MRRKGFTLIELVIVVTILAILAAVAIPTFQNMQKHAKDSATKGILGQMRSAIHLYRMNEIATGRQLGTGGFPQNGCPGVFQVASFEQNPTTPKVMENGIVPDNPWASIPGFENYVVPMGGLPRGTINPNIPLRFYGWAYNNNCEIWAHSTQNGGVNDPNNPNPTENWY